MKEVDANNSILKTGYISWEFFQRKQIAMIREII